MPSRLAVMVAGAALCLVGCGAATADPFDSLPAEVGGNPVSYVEQTVIGAPQVTELDRGLAAAGYAGSERRNAVGRITAPRPFELYAHQVVGAGPDLLDLVHEAYRYEPVVTERLPVGGKEVIRLVAEDDRDQWMVFYRYADTVVVLYGSGPDVEDALRQLP